ncbi:MAG: 5'/3'-nucleotidase SurE [Endomicrobium sp.]|jgi:5'-nucleotidase|nr:5'/3'-nucleotidase SurE [Endomicrobium sp.]
MYKILISNDDGINGPGLRPLVKELSKIAAVYVVVPKKQMSGTGHGISLSKCKKVEKLEKNFYILNGGTPVDCVKYGLYVLFKNKIDLVVSGINTCPNLGRDVVYSGTVGAAREGAMHGIPSLAVSAAEMYARDYTDSSQAARKISEMLLLKNKKFFKDICLNINIPKGYKGMKVVPLAVSDSAENVETIIDENGNFSYKLSGKYIVGRKNKGSDIDAVRKGYISLTPLQIDQTNSDLLKEIQNKIF